MSAMLRFVLVASVSLLIGTVFVIWRVQGSDETIVLAETPPPNTHTPTISNTAVIQEPVDTLPLPTVASATHTATPSATPTAKVTLTATATASVTQTVVAASPTPLPPTHAPPSPTSTASQVPMLSFTVDKTTADWEDTVTLSWATTESNSPLSLRIQGFQVNGIYSDLQPLGGIIATWGDLPAEGSITIPLSETLGHNQCLMERLTWELVADNGVGAVNGALTTTITYDDLPFALDSLTLAPNPVAAYDPVTVTWEGQGGSKFLWFANSQLSDFEEHVKYWTYFSRTGTSGSHEWIVERHAPTIKYEYKYTSVDAALPAICGVVTLNVSCPYSFWQTEPDFNSDSCPTSDLLTIPAAYQPFERGVMVWDSDLHAIHVLYNDGTNTVFFLDDWAGQEITYPESPPEGMSLPQRGFGLLWTSSEDVRQRLGWATGAEQPYSMTRQWVKIGFSDFYKGYHPYGPIYFTMPDSRVVRAPLADVNQNSQGGYEGTGWTYRN